MKGSRVLRRDALAVRSDRVSDAYKKIKATGTPIRIHNGVSDIFSTTTETLPPTKNRNNIPRSITRRVRSFMSLPKVLDVPVSYFFDEMPSHALSGRTMSGRGRKGFCEAGTPFGKEKDPLIKRETLELMRAYDKIDEERVRRSIFVTVKALGEASHAKLFANHRKR